MSNSDIDYIEAELRQTTSSGSKTNPWPPTKGHWANAYARLESLRTTPPPPPPPPTGTVLFDGRAKLMSQIATSGSPPNVVQTQVPAGMWDGLDFTHGDITLVPDPIYTTLYNCAVATGDANPWGGSDSLHGAAQLAKRRVNTPGSVNYFAFGIRIPSWNGPLTDLFFSEIASLGYQTSQSSQVAIGMLGKNGALWFSVDGNAGETETPTPGVYAAGTSHYNTTFLPVTFGDMHEFVGMDRVATTNLGHVTLWHRVRGSSGVASAWGPVYDYTGPTALWGNVHGNIYPQDTTGQDVLDKIGLYFQEYGGESETIQTTGLVRATDLATAQATFPA